MILHPPFIISARLLPALKIGDGYLSWDGSVFYLDTPEFEYVVDDFHPGAGCDRQECFRAILSFLDAALESRAYRIRTGRESENEDLFPPHVLDWAEQYSDVIEMLSIDLEEVEDLIEE